jgi:hypothetical protein
MELGGVAVAVGEWLFPGAAGKTGHDHLERDRGGAAPPRVELHSL